MSKSDPIREIENIEMNTHLRFLTLPLDVLILEVDIFDSKIPPSRQPKKKLVDAISVCRKI